MRRNLPGLRSEALYDRILAERQRRTVGGAAHRLAQELNPLVRSELVRVAASPLRPARLRGRKPR